MRTRKCRWGIKRGWGDKTQVWAKMRSRKCGVCTKPEEKSRNLYYQDEKIVILLVSSSEAYVLLVSSSEASIFIYFLSKTERLK